MVPHVRFHSVSGGIVSCVGSGECRVDSVISICSCVGGVNRGGDVSGIAITVDHVAADDSDIDGDVRVDGG